MLRNLKHIFRQEVFKNFATLLSGTTLAQVIALLSYPLITRLYTPEEMGVFGTYMVLAGIIGEMATAKYEDAIMLPAKPKDGFHILVLSLIITIIISIFFTVFIILIFPMLVKIQFVAELGHWTYLIPLSILTGGIMKSFIKWANRRKYFQTIASNNLFKSGFNSAFKVGFGAAGLKTGGLIGGAILGNGIASTIITSKMLQKDKLRNYPLSKRKIKYWAKHYINFPKFQMLHGLVNNLSGNLPTLFFANYFTTASAGFYFLGFTVVFRPISLFSNAVEQVISQRIIAKNNENLPIKSEVYDFLKSLFLLGILPFTVFALFTPEIFTFLFSSNYTESGEYVQILIPWLFMVYLVSPMSFIPDMYYRQRKAMTIEMIYFILRVTALAVGIINSNIYLTLLLFSLTGFLVLGYKLIWYLLLIHKNQLPK